MPRRYIHQFNRVVIGDVTNASGNEQMLRGEGNIKVDILEGPVGIALCVKYRAEKSELEMEN